MIHTRGIIYGETVTAAIENGVPQTVYGAVIVTTEMLKCWKSPIDSAQVSRFTVPCLFSE